MQLLGKYIFSRRTDFLAFTTFIPVFFLYLLCFKSGLVTLPDHAPPEFFLLGWILVDGSHVYSTYLVSYGDKDMVKQLKSVFIIVPAALITSAFILYFTGIPVPFLHFLAYLAMVHFIRQEYGWMKIASRLDSSAPKWLYYTDLATAYAMTIIPMLWWTRASKTGFWYSQGDLFPTPDVISNFSMYLYWPFIAMFLGTNGWHAWKSKKINSTKLLVATNIFFGWYMSKVIVSNVYLAVWLMIFHHGLPYYFIVFKTERITSQINWLEKLGKFKYPALYLMCAAVFYLFLKSHSGNSFVLGLKKESNFFSALFFAIAVTPQMTHFILDGYIWKKKYGLVGGVGSKKPAPALQEVA